MSSWGPDALAAATVCKTAKQHYFTFGFGGAIFDKLTHVYSSLSYCYNDTYVWGSSTTGSSCNGASELGWAWVVNSCVYVSQSLSQSTNQVWSTVRGNFHCNPPANAPCSLSNPDGYFHRLFAKVTAFQSGHSSCTNWWDGQIVLGPEMEIISGCT